MFWNYSPNPSVELARLERVTERCMTNMYDNMEYTGVEIEPCTEPPESCLHDGLEWDATNLSHCTRLTKEQVESGLLSGYLMYEDDPKECRYRVLFRASSLDGFWNKGKRSIWRLIIDTSEGKMRPITVLKETNAKAIKDFEEAERYGLE